MKTRRPYQTVQLAPTSVATIERIRAQYPTYWRDGLGFSDEEIAELYDRPLSDEEIVARALHALMQHVGAPLHGAKGGAV